MKKILIIQGNPKSESFGRSLADAYEKGALASGAEVRRIEIGELNFNPNLSQGFAGREEELEEDLKRAQQSILWAEHLVIVYPVWWSTMPGLLKAFFDRAFLPGFAFKYRKGSSLWDKLLKGRSARVLTTMDTPGFIYKFLYGKPAEKIMKRGILEFCGISPVKVTNFSPVRGSNEEKRNRWLTDTEQLGKNLG